MGEAFFILMDKQTIRLIHHGSFHHFPYDLMVIWGLILHLPVLPSDNENGQLGNPRTFNGRLNRKNIEGAGFFIAMFDYQMLKTKIHRFIKRSSTSISWPTCGVIFPPFSDAPIDAPVATGGFASGGMQPRHWDFTKKLFFFATWELFSRHYVALHIEVGHTYIYIHIIIYMFHLKKNDFKLVGSSYFQDDLQGR